MLEKRGVLKRKKKVWTEIDGVKSSTAIIFTVLEARKQKKSRRATFYVTFLPSTIIFLSFRHRNVEAKAKALFHCC